MTILDRRSLLLGAGASVLLPGCTATPTPTLPATPRAAQLLAAARRQIGVTTQYDAGYTSLPFPNGDVPRTKGVCTDVIVRAYRDAFGLDLQALVHADMQAAFAAYPRTWGLSRPDPSIDHRRVPNLGTWLRRKGASLPIPRTPRAGGRATSSLPWSTVAAPISASSRTAPGPTGRSSSTISAGAPMRRTGSSPGR